MTLLPRVLRITAVLLTAFLGVACSGGRKPVFPVRGKVLFEGKPTPDALVIFHPLDDPDPKTPQPVARVGADGNFSPTTWTADDGAPAGRYAVTVTWVKERDNQDAPREDQRPPQNLLPERYGKPETSRLEVHIKPGTNELEPFRLTRK